MDQRILDHRTGIRFKIPGADLSFRTHVPLLLFLPSHREESCPLIDISRGGCLFTSQKPLKLNTRLRLDLHIPDVKKPLHLKGYVIWIYPNSGKSSRYETGVRFNSYGEGKSQNPARTLIKIIDLENKHVESPPPKR